MQQNQVSADLVKLKEGLSPLPEPVVNPPFVVVSGLPGTGKSFFCRNLAQRMPFLILESDVLRKKLFPSPSYSVEESARLFSACHRLIAELLEKGIPVIFDATNLLERHRERLYQISDNAGAKLIIVRIQAPSAVVRQRLQARQEGVDPEDKSDAGWGVYQRMKYNAERIRRNHFVVDTSRDITPAIDKIMRAIRNW